jgi:hypothetical protein
MPGHSALGAAGAAAVCCRIAFHEATPAARCSSVIGPDHLVLRAVAAGISWYIWRRNQFLSNGLIFHEKDELIIAVVLPG